jgi:hypothetical protein
MPQQSGYYKATSGSPLPEAVVKDNFQFMENLAYAIFGQRILSGFTLTPTTPNGLQIDITAGTAINRRLLEITTTTRITGLPPNSTLYFYLLDDGTFFYSTSSTPPSPFHILLGSATTDATGVTSVNNSPKEWGFYFKSDRTGYLFGDPSDPTTYINITQKELQAKLLKALTGIIANLLRLENQTSNPPSVSGSQILFSKSDGLYSLLHPNTPVKIVDPTTSALDGFNSQKRLTLSRGGTQADLSTTGGANRFIRQTSTGAPFTAGLINTADLPNMTLQAKTSNYTITYSDRE